MLDTGYVSGDNEVLILPQWHIRRQESSSINMQKDIIEMFTTIGADNFDSEVIAEVIAGKRAVLLAYIVPDFAYRQQIEALESVSKKYSGDSVKICLLNEDFIKSHRHFRIAGSPTFIIFYQGREKGRMLGKADKESLSSFILQTLPNLRVPENFGECETHKDS